MPQYNRAELGRMATESGFVRDTFEKVLRLKEILRFMNEDEFLREHLLLKGGTAINLTVFNLPRLSVDIDMDYTPNDTREDMLECREKITNVIKEYMESEGYLLSDASRFSHSLMHFTTIIKTDPYKDYIDALLEEDNYSRINFRTHQRMRMSMRLYDCKRLCLPKEKGVEFESYCPF